MSEEYETVVLVKNDVNVYRIPPRQSNRSYRAADWNLSAPDWKGRMRVVSCGENLTLKLEDASTGELFAKCPVDPENPGQALESVSDSSRYFVIRLQDDNGRTAFIGIGFDDRGDSFDLNVVIQDHIKHLKAEKMASEEMNTPQPALDLTLKTGETITLQINTKRQPPKNRNFNDDDDDDDDDDEGGPSKARLRTRETLAAKGITAQSNQGGGLLPPPPAGKRGRSPDRRRPNSEGYTACKPDPSEGKSALEMFDSLKNDN